MELQRAVQECSETDRGEEDREDEDPPGGRRESNRDIYQRLLNILTRLLHESGASAEGGGEWDEKGHVHSALNF